jgi:NitT/TauT family transport system substrate-binding protein
VIIANEQTLNTRPDLAKRFLHALRLSFLYMRDHPEETAAYVHTLIPQQNLEIETASLKESDKHVFTWKNDAHTFGQFDPVKVRTTYSWVVRATHVPATVDPESFIDRRFFVAG